MADVVDRATRSRMMAGIQSRNTRPELAVRCYLHAAGLRFVLHSSDLPGRPDVVFPSRRIAVFVHGCFWHRHPCCRLAASPSTRTEFWERKFAANVDRDRRNHSDLIADGWRVETIWECETRDEACLDELFWRIASVPVRRRPASAY